MHALDHRRNGFHNKINTSLFVETATFMKDSGLLAAGYDLVTLGGIGYANGSTWPDGQQGWGPAGPGNITRNASGFLVVDPVRFPGGNEGMRALTDKIRGMGFRWGHYTEAGTAGCNGAKGSSEGFETQDAALFFDDFKSEYLMVDSCGVVSRPPPDGPPPGYNGGQARWEMSKWRTLIDAAQQKGGKPIVLHDCHNGCGSGFGGPTLAALPCNESDPAQLCTTLCQIWTATLPRLPLGPHDVFVPRGSDVSTEDRWRGQGAPRWMGGRAS